MNPRLASIMLGIAGASSPAFAQEGPQQTGWGISVSGDKKKIECPEGTVPYRGGIPMVREGEQIVGWDLGISAEQYTLERCLGQGQAQEACGEGAYNGMVCATPITESTVSYKGKRHRVAPGTVSNDLEGLCKEEKQICIDESGLTPFPLPKPKAAPTPVGRTPRVAPNAAPILTVGSYDSIRDVKESFVIPLTVKDDGRYDLLVSNGSGATIFYNQNEGVNTHPVDLLKLGKLPAGTHTYTASVSDGHNPKVTQTFDLEVLANGAPTISGESMIEVKKGETVSYTVTITDPENDDARVYIGSENTGLTVTDPSEIETGKYSFDITASEDLEPSSLVINVRGVDEFGAEAKSLPLEVKVTAAAVLPPSGPTEPAVPEYQNLQPNTLQAVFAWTGRDSRFAGLEYTRDLVPKSKWQLRLGAAAGVLFGNDITPIPNNATPWVQNGESYASGFEGEEWKQDIGDGTTIYHVWNRENTDMLKRTWDTPANATWDLRVPALVGTPYFAKGTLNVAAGAMAEIVGPRTVTGELTTRTDYVTSGHLEQRDASGEEVINPLFAEINDETGSFDPETTNLSRRVPVQVYGVPRLELNFAPAGVDNENSPIITAGVVYSPQTNKPAGYLTAGWTW